MGRIRQMINVQGRQSWTLFDSGARNTYITPAVAAVLTTSSIPHPIRTALGGKVRESNRAALLEAEVEGRPISTHAVVLDDIGRDDDGNLIEVLFGALAMQQWGIRLIPEQEKIDLSNYPSEFVEF
jgi:Aspartyl protease